MAEAVVEERSQVPTRFYCHMCNVEINIPNTDYTCPLCSGGFIEELPANAPAVNNLTSNAEAAGSSVGDAHRLNDLETIRGEIATLLMSRNGPNVEISIDPGNRRGNLLTLGSNPSSSIRTGRGGNTAGGRVRQQNYDRLDNVLMDFLQSISGDVDTPFGNSQMFFMGNPGDYAWGREGIDTIVTQLLNQMETSGPPPLAREKIDEIPKVEMTRDEVDKKLQCSVCWEDFRLQEIVRKLPCSHIYHENCIVPWLDLHGTCPICRKSLAGDEECIDAATIDNNIECPMHSNSTVTPTAFSGNRSSVNTAMNTTANANASGSGIARNNTSSIAAAGNNQTTQQNNIFAFDDGNVDLD